MTNPTRQAKGKTKVILRDLAINLISSAVQL